MTIVIFDYFNFLPTQFEAIVVNITMLMELIGIKIAATTGDKFAVIAKDSPTILYKKETVKLSLIIVIACLLILGKYLTQKV